MKVILLLIDFDNVERIMIQDKFIDCYKRFQLIPDYGFFSKHPGKFTSVHLELTNICGYKCFFCPRDEFTRPFGIMSMDDLKFAIQQIGQFDGLVRLHGYGDPLLVEDLPEKISFIRKSWPNCTIAFISTLGYEVSKEFLESIVTSGLNHLTVSFYGANSERYQQIHGVNRFEIALKNVLFMQKLKTKYSDKFNMVVLTENFGIGNQSIREKKAFQELLDSYGINHSEQSLTNRGGSKLVYYKVNTLLPCSVAWGFYAGRLEVTWNLNVVPCCSIWNDNIVFGNLKKQTIEEIFTGKVYVNFIESILTNNLKQFPICAVCERDLQGSKEETESIIYKFAKELTLSFKKKHNRVLICHDMDIEFINKAFDDREIYKENIFIGNSAMDDSLKKVITQQLGIDTVIVLTRSSNKQNKIIKCIQNNLENIKILNIFGTSKASNVSDKVKLNEDYVVE